MLRNSVLCAVTWLIAGINRLLARIAKSQYQAEGFALQSVSVTIGLSGNQIDDSSAGKAIGTGRLPFCKNSVEGACIVGLQTFACLILTILMLAKRTSQPTETTLHLFG